MNVIMSEIEAKRKPCVRYSCPSCEETVTVAIETIDLGKAVTCTHCSAVRTFTVADALEVSRQLNDMLGGMFGDQR